MTEEKSRFENWVISKLGKALGEDSRENGLIFKCLEKMGEKKEKECYSTRRERESRTLNRIRYPGREISGQWNSKFVREVGKKDLKLWEKDWLRRGGKRELKRESRKRRKLIWFFSKGSKFWFDVEKT